MPGNDPKPPPQNKTKMLQPSQTTGIRAHSRCAPRTSLVSSYQGRAESHGDAARQTLVCLPGQPLRPCRDWTNLSKIFEFSLTSKMGITSHLLGWHEA